MLDVGYSMREIKNKSRRDDLRLAPDGSPGNWSTPPKYKSRRDDLIWGVGIKKQEFNDMYCVFNLYIL
jgi:hypothetical protein